MKRCTVCGEAKELAAFAVDRLKADGLCVRCRSCRRKAYVDKHEIEIGRAACWYRNNTKRSNERSAAYYEANRSDLLLGHAERYRASEITRERMAQYGREYREARPGYANALNAKRRAAILKATPKWADLEKIASIYEQAARRTMETGSPYHVDHFYPLQGRTACGLHVHTNLCILPASQNIAKGNRLPAGA